MNAVRTRSAETVTLGVGDVAPLALPVLDRVGLRMAGALRDMLARSGATVRIAAEEPRILRFSEWKGELPALVASARYRVPAFRGGMLASIAPALVGVLVDAFYGGSGDAARERKGFSAAELRFIERIARQIGDAAAAAWADIAPVEPEFSGCTTVPAEIALVRAVDFVAVHQFSVAGRSDGAAIDIVYPVAALRALSVPAEGGNSEGDDSDPAWRTRLSAAVMQARLPVRTVLARPTLPLDRLMTLMPGDVIPVCLPASVPLTVAGRLLAHGTIGEANGRAAIKIAKLEQGGAFQ